MSAPQTPTSRTAEGNEPSANTPRRRRISSFILRLRSDLNKAMATETSSPNGNNMTSTLHRLPVELWEEIFKPLCADWNGKTPNLIKALRPDKKLYNEALRVFYKYNMFIFHRRNGWSFGDMTKEAVLNLEKVKIIIQTDIMKEGLWKLGVPKDEESVLTPNPPASLSDASNIRELILEFKDKGNFETFPPFILYGSVEYSSNYLLTSFHKLRRVDLVLPTQNFDIVNDNWILIQDREEKVADGIKKANARLGVPAKLSRVTALHIEDDDFMEQTMAPWQQWQQWLGSHDEWFWQAEEGSFLKEPASKTPKLPPYESLPNIKRLSTS